MATKRKVTIRTGLLVPGLAISVGLAGCSDMPGSANIFEGSVGGTSIPGVVDGPARLTIEERDVEAPDVFERTDKAIWDGRPSFGGVWAAVPGEIQPERVRIENTENGQSVVGALFKREAANPGPPIEVSSDAAAALGIIPGEPVELKIVALRREAVDVTPPVDPDATPGAIATTTLDPVPGVGELVDAEAPAPAAETPAPTTETTQAEAPAAPTGPAPDKPFVQVGTFSSQANADGLTKILADNGITAEVRSRTMDNGKVLYRVIAGPAASDADLATLSDRVSGLGFTDAFPVDG